MMRFGQRFRGRDGKAFSVMRLARMDMDQIEALLALARVVSRENVKVIRTSGNIHPTAVISPLASLRFGENLEIGPEAAIGPYCAVWGGFREMTRVEAGAMLGPGAVVVAGNHRVDAPGRIRDLGFDEHEASVGEGAWVGANATVIGCAVGAGAVVAANSVVVDDVPAGTIVAGAPAKVIRFRRMDSEQEDQ